ncbi:unnamed protein product, partial [Dovyalis caffra]
MIISGDVTKKTKSCSSILSGIPGGKWEQAMRLASPSCEFRTCAEYMPCTKSIQRLNTKKRTKQLFNKIQEKPAERSE